MSAARLSRRAFLRTSTAAALALYLPRCGSSPVARERTVRLAGNTFGFPSPFSYIAGPGYRQMILLYDTLLWKDGSGRLLPWLARRVERSRDGLTYRFELREGVRWHDGRPLTAEDVAFTYDYFREQPLGPLLVAQPFGVARARAVSERVAEIRLRLPAVTFDEQVAGAVPIIPRHVWSAIEDAPRAQELDVLVGSGPYRLESFSRGEGALLYAENRDYFLGRPYVRRVELRPVDDELVAVRAGEIDVAEAPVEGVRPEVLDRFRDDESFGIAESTGGFTFPLIWNLGRGGPLADVRFRRACALAIDRGAIVERLLGGNGLPGNPGFLPPGHPFHVRVAQYAFDPASAERLLDEAGYRRRGDRNLRHDTEGLPLSFELLTGNAPVPAVLPLLVDAFARIGVEVRPRSVDLPSLFDRLQRGADDIVLSLYPGPGGTAPDADPDVLRTFYSSDLDGRLQGAQGWVDAEFDSLARRQLVTLERDRRARLIRRMQQIVARDVPALPLYYPTLFTVFRRRVFDRWYYTPGGFASGLPGVQNKHVLVTGEKTGLGIRSE